MKIIVALPMTFRSSDLNLKKNTFALLWVRVVNYFLHVSVAAARCQGYCCLYLPFKELD